MPESTLPIEFVQDQVITPEPVQEPDPLPDLVLKINQKNKSIDSFVCNNVMVETWEKGTKFRFNADFHYEKYNNFRMIFSSVFGKELDLGSNEQKFWYWSRRDKHPGVYWANHEDYQKTRLKDPFNPMFIQDSFGFNEIPQEGAQVTETDLNIFIKYDKVNSMGDPISYIIFVNKKTELINGFCIVDENGITTVTAEIQEYKNGLPSKLVYLWAEEAKVLVMNLHNPEINVHIPSSLWKMPNETPKIDMSKEF